MSPVALCSRLSIAECLRSLDSAAEKSIGYYHFFGNRVTFELERVAAASRSVYWLPTSMESCEAKLIRAVPQFIGPFGFPPRTRAGAIGVDVLVILGLTISVSFGRSSSVEWVALALVFGTLGLFVNRCRLHHE